ncbi:hypothetical protein FNV43_RR25844 [Rhamnella rubrinervis]|uniref:BAHD acyltransferase n=1 Tax=Rhamnella rubrinervis TaxID=2594499 RepID=A0A8K0DMX6_9ROSA|nr:hypothetical protein FNV43_RR25844 [Rhamnella rubrinervis]
MKIEISARETIKPSSPTPIHLQSFKLSLLDQLAPPVYISLVFFYPKNDDVPSTDHLLDHKSHHLKNSLSQALTRFYPLAGRIKDDKSVDCHDDGAHYVEARCHGLLSSFLQHPINLEQIKLCLPIMTESPEAFKGSLLLVQVTFFDCGGLAIGVNMSHKLADSATMGVFIKDWAAIALGHGDTLPFPDFEAASKLFPHRDFSFQQPTVEFKRAKCAAKRFVFDASKIEALKAEAASTSVKHPSRVEAVTALIWKCAMSASSARRTSNSVLTHSGNLRNKVEPPLSDKSFGNLAWFFAVKTDIDSTNTTKIQDLVCHLRKGIKEFGDVQAKRFQGEDRCQVVLESFKEGEEMIRREDLNLFIFTSWCKFPLYEVDYGWGKPIWLTNTPSGSLKNVVTMLDTREGDGVEAWVTLTQQDMELFERDPELLAFALLNPNVF